MTHRGNYNETLVSVGIGVLMALSVIALHVAANEGRPLPPEQREAQTDEKISFNAYVVDVERDSLVVDFNQDTYDHASLGANGQVRVLTSGSTTIEHRGQALTLRQIIPTSQIHVSGILNEDQQLIADTIIVVFRAEPRDAEMLEDLPEHVITEMEQMELESASTSSSTPPEILPDDIEVIVPPLSDTETASTTEETPVASSTPMIEAIEPEAPPTESTHENS